MGLMDKFKNLFTDEEVIEEEEETVEIKEVKKEEKSKLPTFMREKIAKEEKDNKKKIIEDEDIGIEKELKLEKIPDEEHFVDDTIEEKPTFKFPIDFTDNDIMETRVSRQAMHNQNKEKTTINPKIMEHEIQKEKHIPPKKELKVSEIYKDKKEEKQKDSRCFRATPIISPIYGIVDKNYDPKDIESNKGHNLADTRPSKSVDFDSVRKKAYGSLTEEIKENLMCENCEYLKEAKKCKKRIDATDYSYNYDDITTNSAEEDYDNITLDEATENYYDYGVEYQKRTTNYYEPELKDEENYYIDDNEEENDVKITNHIEESEERVKKNKEIPPVKSSINLLSTLKKSMGDEEEQKEKNLDLTDDLFNLIDSMYDERNDDK